MIYPTRPLISIITPAYNSGPKLKETIQSVLSQDPSLYEYIVMDGASTDGSTTLLKSYEQKLHWVSEPDQGVYDAMNKGLALSQGRYVYFLGAGDTLKSGILTRVAPLLPLLPRVFAYGNVQIGTVRQKFNGRYSRWKLSRVNICHQALFCTRDIFDMIGFFDLRYPILSDYVFNLECFGNRDITKIYFNEVIADFEVGGLSARQQDAQFLTDRLRLFRKNLGFWPYAINKALTLIPADLKEARYQAFRRLKMHLARRRG